VRWTCSSVKGNNEPSKPIRIKKIHSHLIIVDEVQGLLSASSVEPEVKTRFATVDDETVIFYLLKF
jgi:hypothetical protein